MTDFNFVAICRDWFINTDNACTLEKIFDSAYFRIVDSRTQQTILDLGQFHVDQRVAVGADGVSRSLAQLARAPQNATVIVDSKLYRLKSTPFRACHAPSETWLCDPNGDMAQIVTINARQQFVGVGGRSTESEYTDCAPVSLIPQFYKVDGFENASSESGSKSELSNNVYDNSLSQEDNVRFIDSLPANGTEDSEEDIESIKAGIDDELSQIDEGGVVHLWAFHPSSLKTALKYIKEAGFSTTNVKMWKTYPQCGYDAEINVKK